MGVLDDYSRYLENYAKHLKNHTDCKNKVIKITILLVSTVARINN